MTEQEMQEQIARYEEGLQESYNKRMKLEKRVRELEAENRELRECMRVLEKAAYKIVLWEAELPECEMCPSRDECFAHRHGENCMCAMDILNSAKEAVQEAGE